MKEKSSKKREKKGKIKKWLMGELREAMLMKEISSHQKRKSFYPGFTSKRFPFHIFLITFSENKILKISKNGIKWDDLIDSFSVTPCGSSFLPLCMVSCFYMVIWMMVI